MNPFKVYHKWIQGPGKDQVAIRFLIGYCFGLALMMAFYLIQSLFN